MYDEDSGLYYVLSRYYNPEVGRWINADDTALLGATGTVLSYNLFAYCENNPVNMVDVDGREAITFTALWACFASIAQVAVATITVGAYIALAIAIGCKVCEYVRSPSIAIPKVKEEEKEKEITATPPCPTLIYRYGGSNPGNLTPKEKDLRDSKGLSFSTKPMPGAAVTTIEALNATGLVRAVKDGATHVSVYPVGGTMLDWVIAGSNSVWTRAVKSVVSKWDGVS